MAARRRRASRSGAKHIDKYLTWGEPPAQVGEKIARVRAAAAAKGHEVSFGIRLHFIVRETDGEAWEAADRLISHLTDDDIAKAQAYLGSQSDSVGQARMTALHGGRRDRLEVSPNLWAGVGLVRGGAGTALVGSPETVAERLCEYQALGIDTVIGSGYPHLEEAYKVAELLFPVLKGSKPQTHDTRFENVGTTVESGTTGESGVAKPRAAPVPKRNLASVR